MEGLLLKDALQMLLEQTKEIKECEIISLWEAAGRVLAEDIIAVRNQPPFDRSPLDGYAVRSEDLKGASKEHPVKLKVIDEVDAGHVTESQVGPGMAVRIMTGAPIPKGADCVVGQEDTDYGEEQVKVYEEIAYHKNYCFEGEDYGEGDLLLKKGIQIGAVESGVLASLGLQEISVFRRPKVTVITTGDEIVLPGEELLPGKIYDSNLYTLVTRLKSFGVEIRDSGRSEDDAEEVAKRIQKAFEDSDLVITTGGVSVGKKDIMHDVLKIMGAKRLFWKIAMKPGMPTLCALYQGKLLICLSGNPFGATVNLELLVRPILAKMTGRCELKIRKKKAICQSEFSKKSFVTRYVRAYYDGSNVQMGKGSNASGILSSMCGCNCLIEIPAGTERVDVGDEVEVVLL